MARRRCWLCPRRVAPDAPCHVYTKYDPHVVRYFHLAIHSGLEEARWEAHRARAAAALLLLPTVPELSRYASALSVHQG